MAVGHNKGHTLGLSAISIKATRAHGQGADSVLNIEDSESVSNTEESA